MSSAKSAASFNQPRQPILTPETDRLRPRGVGRVKPPKSWLDERRGFVATAALAGPEVAAEKKAANAGKKLSAGQRLLQRATMGWSEFDQARLDALGYNGWLNEQLDPESLDDSPLEEILAEALPALSLTAAQTFERYENQRAQPIFQLIAASLYRATYSPRQLFERAVIFWSDHFSIDLFSGVEYLLKPTDDRDVIRRHAMGTFPELLSASAHSPAMLTYLTNTSNVAGHPNENYARELMELHTMGADGPYTEKDVKEVARCFTGWGVVGARGGSELGEFRFNARNHDDGSKVVLGHTIPAGGGVSDGERVLEILSSHPATAEFIATKMLRYFQRYEPKKSTVKKVASVYTKTGGDVRKMLKTILKKKRMRKAEPKLKRPFHLMVSALRVLNAELKNSRALLEDLYATGHLPFAWSPPNGYPDSRGFWVGFLLPRWNFAGNLADSNSGVGVEQSILDTSMSPIEITDQIDEHMFNGKLSEASRIAIEEFAAAAGEPTNKKLLDAIRLALSSPEFQDY